MARTFDPLACIPSPEAVRGKLAETLTLAERLRILLDVSERIHSPQPTATTSTGDRAEEAAGAR